MAWYMGITQRLFLRVPSCPCVLVQLFSRYTDLYTQPVQDAVRRPLSMRYCRIPRDTQFSRRPFPCSRLACWLPVLLNRCIVPCSPFSASASTSSSVHLNLPRPSRSSQETSQIAASCRSGSGDVPSFSMHPCNAPVRGQAAEQETITGTKYFIQRAAAELAWAQSTCSTAACHIPLYSLILSTQHPRQHMHFLPRPHSRSDHTTVLAWLQVESCVVKRLPAVQDISDQRVEKVEKVPSQAQGKAAACRAHGCHLPHWP